MRTFSGGRNTVPQIFFNADHLGGNDDVQKVLQQHQLLLLLSLQQLPLSPLSSSLLA